MIKSIFQSLFKSQIILITPVLFSLLTFSTQAQYKQQNFEVTPFAGYLFPGNIKTLEGELRIENHFNYGLVLDVRTTDDLFIEFLYNRTDTEIRFKQEYFDTIKTLFDMSVEYFQAGAHVEVETGRFR